MVEALTMSDEAFLQRELRRATKYGGLSLAEVMDRLEDHEAEITRLTADLKEATEWQERVKDAAFQLLGATTFEKRIADQRAALLLALSHHPTDKDGGR